MADKLAVHVVGTEERVLTCDEVKEGDHGVHLYDTQNGKENIGYVPFPNLDYVGPRNE
ncbi:hypothetical protein OB920_09795 [Halobacteria archaeon HArc-gm2]|nr:hypothetical protein [Halobacteria archaeon HArc-gm2]